MGVLWGNNVWAAGVWSGGVDGKLFDNIVEWVEKQPSETMFKPGFFQPGLFSECKLLTENIREFEK
jgi:hypothetical protein